MTETEIKEIVQKQRTYFYTGATLPVDKRIEALKKLKSCIQKYEPLINEALKRDLGKSNFESYMCEVGLVLSELSYMIRHTPSYAKEKNVITPLAQFASRSYKKPSPYGVVLVMSPWNYPFLLSLDPLIDAIAAGNTVILKPSAYSPNTSKLIEKMIRECFSPEMVAVVTGGRAENTSLLEEHFDYIFFTGSQNVGREVMKKSSAHLTPVTLELGGKSPCIVDESADLKLAARRIVFGKYLNCGQTCVAPDYILVERSVKDEFLVYLKKWIVRMYGADATENDAYVKMINQKHFDRVTGLIDPEKVIFGGGRNERTMQIQPTILDDVTAEDAVMQEEIFGPIFPILSVDSMAEAEEFICKREKPLALYLFTQNKALAERFLRYVPFGGGCINDTIIHLATHHMGFGGVGSSGMGSYHGRKSFDTFSHEKSILKKSVWIDMPVRYMPYTPLKTRLLRLFLR